MSVAHLFGNWKWTGPADPVLGLVHALGPEARLLCGPCPYADLEHRVQAKALELGVDVQILSQLRKHWNPLRTSRAAAQVLDTVRDGTLLHTHFDADHATAQRAARHRIASPVVRSIHHQGPFAARERSLLARRTQLVLAPSPHIAGELEAALHWSAGDVGIVEVGVDLDRFESTEERRRRGREQLGLGAQDFAFGIVARIQTHRRWDLLLDAWTRLKTHPHPPKLVIFGRGTKEEELVHEPVRQRGLEDLVIRPGYQKDDLYLDALAACDAGIFLVPGTDVSCRAVREWMGMGRAVVATKRDPLPELIEDGVTGALIEETPESLATTVTRWTAAEWQDRGANARTAAHRRFSLQRMAEITRTLYRSAHLALPGASAKIESPCDSLAVMGPGYFSDSERWSESSPLLLSPRTSRDVVLDMMHVVERARVRRLLLAPHPEWDRPLLRELRRRRMEVSLLTGGEADSAWSQWLRELIPEHFASHRSRMATAASGHSTVGTSWTSASHDTT